MRFFTFDRLNILQEGEIVTLFDDYSIAEMPEGDCMVGKLNELYPEGISEHGNSYIFSLSDNILNCHSSFIESFYELIRQLHYPEMLSRFQSFFAVEEADIDKFTRTIDAVNAPLYEITADRVEKHDMNLLKGANFATCLYYAHHYWSGMLSEDPLVEYLLKPPVTVIRQIK